MNAKLLVIEDEQSFAEVLRDNLEVEGYSVSHAADGEEGKLLWQQLDPDLIVLDVMLPKLSGFELCKQMRKEGDRTPVLFLSAKGQAADRVKGLSAGGDDYLAKPFHLPEFLLRVANMLKRQRWAEQLPKESKLDFGGHTVDFRSWNATLANGKEELLGEREVGILKLLASRPNNVVSRDDILDEVWGNDVFPSSRTVDNFVVRLRKLFEPQPSEPIYFHTIWGVGYKFTPEGKVQEVIR